MKSKTKATDSNTSKARREMPIARFVVITLLIIVSMMFVTKKIKGAGATMAVSKMADLSKKYNYLKSCNSCKSCEGLAEKLRKKIP